MPDFLHPEGQDADDEVFMPDQVNDFMIGNRRINDPDYVVGLCSECKSVMPQSYMERNVFAAEGSPVPCKFCGGVCVITYGELINESLLENFDMGRGIGRS